MSDRVPDGTTMEGMIWNANHVCTAALKPGANGIPKTLFQKAKGIMLISIVEVGFIFSGTVGTGILLKKKDDGSGGWSLPAAVGLSGMGWGFLVGGSIKDLIIFYFDEKSLLAAASDGGFKFSGQVEATVGPFGRSSQIAVDVSSSGTGLTGSFAVAFSQGGFLGVNINGSMVGPRNAANTAFYGKDVSARDIIYDVGVTYPKGKVTLLDCVYQKLALLSHGTAVEVDTTVTKEQKSAALSAVQAASVTASQMDGVEHVDASAKASAVTDNELEAHV